MLIGIHLPRALREALDRKAKALGISRSQLVVRALERELGDSSDWSPGFFERLSDRNQDTAEAVDELRREIRRARRSKSALQL